MSSETHPACRCRQSHLYCRHGPRRPVPARDDSVQDCVAADPSASFAPPPSQPPSQPPLQPPPPVAAVSAAPEAGMAVNRPGESEQPSQGFANLLFAAALTCHAPVTVLAVAEPEGRWTTRSYGILSGDMPPDNDLFAALGRGPQPLEIIDLPGHAEFGDSPLTTKAFGIRYVYGISLRTPGSALLGVLCVLDRHSRQLPMRERQAMDAIADKIVDRLAVGRRMGAQPPAVAPRPGNGDRPAAVDLPVDVLAITLAEATREPLLFTNEVSALFGVTSRTVVNWASGKLLPSIRTPGGQIRFQREDVMALLAQRLKRF